MKQITLRVSDDLYSDVEKLASDADRSFNYMAAKLLEQAVREKKRKKGVKNSGNSSNFAQGEE